VSSTAQLVGFAGDQLNYDESAPHFRWTGHVGLRYHQEPQADTGGTLFGRGIIFGCPMIFQYDVFFFIAILP
jgi:hypothetical protein